MTTVYKCDRCDNIVSEIEVKRLSGNITHNLLQPGWYPTRVDLCPECSKELRKLLGDWWDKCETLVSHKVDYVIHNEHK